MSGKANVDKVIHEIRSLRSKLSEMTPVSPLSNQKRPKTPEPKKLVERKLADGEEISRNISKKMQESQHDIKEQLHGFEVEMSRKEKIDRGYEEVADELRGLVVEKEKIIRQQLDISERQKKEIERLTRALQNAQNGLEEVKSKSEGEVIEFTANKN
jgi:hypothetical protein